MEVMLRYTMFGIAAALLAAAVAGGDGSALIRASVHGFGWGVGREVAHEVLRHALR